MKTFGIIFLLVCAALIFSGCVGNKAGINSPLISVPEKNSPAEEAGVWVDLFDRILK